MLNPHSMLMVKIWSVLKIDVHCYLVMISLVSFQTWYPWLLSDDLIVQPSHLISMITWWPHRSLFMWYPWLHRPHCSAFTLVIYGYLVTLLVTFHVVSMVISWWTHCSTFTLDIHGYLLTSLKNCINSLSPASMAPLTRVY